MRTKQILRILVGPVASLVLLCPLLLGNSECNAFSGTADKTGDSALLYSARQLLDQSKYTEALTTLGQMTAAGQAGHDAIVLKASAHAGLCGLNLVTFGYNLSNAITAGTKVLPALLAEMKSATSYTECTAAETLMLSIPAAQMTNDDYIFLTFVEFAKIGAALETASVDTSVGQGVVNPSLNTCVNDTQHAPPYPTPLTDTIVGEIGAGLTIAAHSISAAGASIGGTITSLCSFVTCTVTSGSSFTPAELLALRVLLKSNEIGFNLCGGSFGTGSCTCP